MAVYSRQLSPWSHVRVTLLLIRVIHGFRGLSVPVFPEEQELQGRALLYAALLSSPSCGEKLGRSLFTLEGSFILERGSPDALVLPRVNSVEAQAYP